jgi:DNA-binding GntR family transcriptional regulator
MARAPRLTPTALRSLKKGRPSLDQVATAERVADVLRGQIADGKLLPGHQLSEEAVGDALGISRNTLREAFRVLCHERLLVHEMNRGVFVRSATMEDIADIYKVRRVLEFSALAAVRTSDRSLLDRMDAAAAAAERAAADEKWMDVGPANNEWHLALVSSLGSRRLNELLRTVLAEIRLAFWQTKQDLHRLYAPYVALNREILELVRRGEHAAAAREFVQYFDKSERDLLSALGDAGRDVPR